MSKGKILVTGACGFIGYCLSKRLLEEGYQVVGIDNLSRKGTELNRSRLQELSGFSLHEVDVTDFAALSSVFKSEGAFLAVYHLAAQVAVTLSYLDRVADFNNNALASFNVIECTKLYTPESYCVYASTNKVYGHIEVEVPVGMSMPLDPYTPYGVSKAVGEMYFTEYGRPEIGLQTCCFRQSCIYGPNQYGVEDQGWVAWFAIANLLRRDVSIYGNGKQVRDLLYVDDLVNLYIKALEVRLTGVYPVGGGTERAISVSQGLSIIEDKSGMKFPSIGYSETRPGDQPYFVADLGWTEGAPVDWNPKMNVENGIESMLRFLKDNLSAIESILAK